MALIAAVGDDQFGQKVMTYLRDEKVDTSLLKVVAGARTPVTGVIELDLGDSIALIWRNEREVSLTVQDIDQLSAQVTNCDALLLTFEIPRETTQRALALAHTDPDSRPVVILTPGQPYPEEGISRSSLRLVDYLVAHAWELDKYGPLDLQRFDPDRVGEHLLARGVETLCFLGNGGGTIYSDTAAGTFRLPTLSSLYKESSTARDAFCAALAAKLIGSDRTFSQDVAKWATAAMACAAEGFAIPTPCQTAPASSSDSKPFPGTHSQAEQRWLCIPVVQAHHPGWPEGHPCGSFPAKAVPPYLRYVTVRGRRRVAEHSEWESPDALVLVHVLEKLRARDGLTVARLQDDRGEAAAPLLRLHATQRFANVHKLDLAPAAIGVVSQCVLETIDGTHRIVADAILALGLFSDLHVGHGIDQRVVQALRADSLGIRRNALLSNWRRLHEAMGLAASEPPSDRALRGTTEREVLRELARQLIRREVNSVGSRSAMAPGAAPSDGAATSPRGRVIVVGGAVMDATFRTKTLPQSETSSEAYGFDLSPGGKGLSQAVAAARLGLDVSLVAAVAGDRFGQEIIHYLRDEGVNTSLLKVIPQARTPFTGVIEMELGDSIAVNWRNQMEVRLDARDVDRLSQELIDCDAVLVTFEIPRETVQCTLELAHAAQENRPLVIVTPGQPYPDDDISRHSLAQIDYMVAHAWELGRYSPAGQDRFDPDPVARHLLAYGVETVCILGNGGCTIYSDTDLQTFSVPSFPSIYKESSAARDAFCAALAAQLIDNDRVFSAQEALWATAAMACATADFPLSNSMPDRRRIEALLSRSPFTVKPQ